MPTRTSLVTGSDQSARYLHRRNPVLIYSTTTADTGAKKAPLQDHSPEKAMTHVTNTNVNVNAGFLAAASVVLTSRLCMS